MKDIIGVRSTEFTLAEKPTVDDRTLFLKSSVSLKQEIKCDKSMIVRILYTVYGRRKKIRKVKRYIIGVRSTEFTLAEKPTVDDRTLFLKSSVSLKQEIKYDNALKYNTIMP